jgi:hypothetical protein
MGRETAAPLALPSARRFDADEADGVRWFLVRRKRTQGARIGRIRRLGWYRIHPRASGIPSRAARVTDAALELFVVL